MQCDWDSEVTLHNVSVRTLSVFFKLQVLFYTVITFTFNKGNQNSCWFFTFSSTADRTVAQSTTWWTSPILQLQITLTTTLYILFVLTESVLSYTEEKSQQESNYWMKMQTATKTSEKRAWTGMTIIMTFVNEILICQI